MNTIHYKWIIGIAVAIISILLALLCCKIDCETQPIMHFLSLIATILSIMLSLFSITFSWYSMTSSSQQWANMSQAITEMKEANGNIKANNDSLLKNVIDLTRDVSALRTRAEGRPAPDNNNVQNGLLNPVNGNNANNVVVPAPGNLPGQPGELAPMPENAQNAQQGA